MGYSDKIQSYSPLFYWPGPYTSPANIWNSGLAAGFPYTQGTLLLWLKKADWGAAGSQLAIQFGSADPYSDLRVRKSAANVITATYTAGGSGRSLAGAVSGVFPVGYHRENALRQN
jgi:hypothetical protein